MAATTYYDTLLRKDANLTLRDSLCHPMKPVFIFGATPPREGTDEAKQLEICEKFVARARVLPVDTSIATAPTVQPRRWRLTREGAAALAAAAADDDAEAP